MPWQSDLDYAKDWITIFNQQAHSQLAPLSLSLWFKLNYWFVFLLLRYLRGYW